MLKDWSIAHHMGETLISWSFRILIHEAHTWYSYVHQTPNSWLCYYRILWPTFWALIWSINPNLGPMCWEIDCGDLCLVWRPWLEGVHHEALIRDAWYLYAILIWLLAMGLTKTLIHWNEVIDHHIMHHQSLNLLYA